MPLIDGGGVFSMADYITSLSLEVAIFCFLFSNTAIAVSSALCIRCLFRAETNKIGKSVNGAIFEIISSS